MSQTARILKLLKAGKKLTPLDALHAGCGMRLSARVLELRQQGYDIKTKLVDKNGARVAQYSL